MLEYVDLTKSIPREEYKKRIQPLQQRLYELEHEIFNQKIPVMIVLEGWGTSGKGKLVNVLAERMDPRGFRVVPIKPPRTSETKYPWMWRFWNKIPSIGQMVAFDTSWYQRVLSERVAGTTKPKEWEKAFQDINEFEGILSNSGMVIIKFWLHISKNELENRINQISADELTRWRITDLDRLQLKKFKKFSRAVEDMLMRTDKPEAQWMIVESNDKHYSRIKVFENIIMTLERHLNIESSIDDEHPLQTTEIIGAANA